MNDFTNEATQSNLIDIQATVKDIIDFLQPSLSPYENVIYWYMFRHSFIESGNNLTRVSITKISQGIGSKFKQNNTPTKASDKTIGDNLRELEKKGAIKKAGETNREGTLYKIILPREIEFCIQKMQMRKVTPTTLVDSKKEQDFYNIKENRLIIFERDKYLCYKCKKLLIMNRCQFY